MREAERRSNPGEKKIATPFGLAMTYKDIYNVCISPAFIPNIPSFQ